MSKEKNSEWQAKRFKQGIELISAGVLCERCLNEVDGGEDIGYTRLCYECEKDTFSGR